MSSSGLRVTVIVPVYNGGEKFRQCLLSLKASQPQPNEIIVVADGDTDGSGQMARELGMTVVSLPSPPQGPAKARNIGADAATGDILFFVDADVKIHENCVGILLRFFQENRDVAAVIGSYDETPFETNFLSQYKNLFHHYTHQRACSEASTFWGACGAIPRDIFLSMGGFDERFTRPSIEDIELGYRLRKKGYAIRLLKDLQVTHLKKWALRGLLRTDIFDRALPWTRLMVQEGRIRSDLNLKIADRISCACVFGLILTVPFAFTNGWAWVGLSFFLSLILILNRDLYAYFRQRRGGVFALKSMLFHWFYYFYSGLAFMIGRISCNTRE